MAFTEKQLQAIHAEGHLMVSACPGSGKTRVITERAVRLVENANNNLALVTFTRAASEEMQYRVNTRTKTNRIKVRTFHAFALYQYKQSKNQQKIASNLVIRNILFRLINETRAGNDNGEPYTYSELKEIIEEFGCLLYPEDIKQEDRGKWEIYRAYLKYLKDQDLIDLQGICRKVVIDMREGRLSPLPITHLLIDEYQDIDNIQLAWVEEHIKRGIFVTVVADDDQSIYAFRRSLGYAGLEQFRTLANPKTVLLDECFRCPSQVLHHAARLIEHNTRRVAKSLRTHTDKPGSVTHVKCMDKTQEAEVVATVLGKHTGTRAVLARKNAELDEIDSAMQALGVEFVRLTGKRFWENETAALYVSLLESLLNPSNSVGVYSVLSYAGCAEDKARDYVEQIQTGDLHLAGGITPAIGQYHQLLKSFRQSITQNWQAAVDEATEYLAVLYENGESRYGYRKHKHLLDLARDAVVTAVKRKGGHGAGGLTQVLKNIHREGMQNKQIKHDGSAVMLMTMHGAKGLEFDTVWIIRANATDKEEYSREELEEERRLFYVAMTRTRQRLYISSQDNAAPSLFLYEANILQSSQPLKAQA